MYYIKIKLLTLYVFIYHFYYTLAMPRPRKHIRSPCLYRRIPSLTEISRITCRRGRIAGYHHDLFGRHFHDRIQRKTVTALSRRVNYYHIGVHSLCRKAVRYLSRIAANEFRIFNSVGSGILFCVLHCLGIISPPISFDILSAMESPTVPAPQ